MFYYVVRKSDFPLFCFSVANTIHILKNSKQKRYTFYAGEDCATCYTYIIIQTVYPFIALAAVLLFLLINTIHNVCS